MATKKKATKKKVSRKTTSRTGTRMVTVSLARLAQEVEVKKVKAGTVLQDFLALYGLYYGADIRVNGKTATARYKLKTGDIVCVVSKVSGGYNR